MREYFVGVSVSGFAKRGPDSLADGTGCFAWRLSGFRRTAELFDTSPPKGFEYQFSNISRLDFSASAPRVSFIGTLEVKHQNQTSPQ